MLMHMDEISNLIMNEESNFQKYIRCISFILNLKHQDIKINKLENPQYIIWQKIEVIFKVREYSKRHI